MKITYFLITILLSTAIMLIVVLPFFRSSYFPMHDDTQPTRIYLMAQALQDGQFPVRWVQYLGYGYGYPIFNFYAPLPYYMGSVPILLGFDAVDSAKILFGFVTIGAFITIFFLLKQFVKTPPAIAGASIYLLFPYHAVNTYVRGALSEQFGYLLIPLIMLFYFKMFEGKNGSKKWLVIFSISLSFLIISHNLSALMAAIVLGPLVIVHFIINKEKKVYIKYLITSLSIALGLSAFYILPVVFESSFTNVSSQVGGGADFKDHFVCLGQFWNSGWGFGGSAPGCLDGLSFKLGKSNMVFGLVSFIFILAITNWKKRKWLNSNVIIALWIIASSLFLMLQVSEVFWSTVPFIKYIQYPWRFLVFTGLGISILIAVALNDIDKVFKKKYIGVIVMLVIIGVTIVDNYSLFVPQSFLKKDIDRYVSPYSIKYEISKISDEYMPKDFKKPQNIEDTPKKHFVSKNSDVLIKEESSSSKKISAHVNTNKNEEIYVQIAPYPSWEFYLDGKKTEYKNLNNGILIQVPSGEHNIVFKFNQTLIQKAGNLASLFTILAFGAVIIFKRLYGKKNI